MKATAKNLLNYTGYNMAKNDEKICVCRYMDGGRTLYLQLFESVNKALDCALRCFEMIADSDKPRITYSIERGLWTIDDKGIILKMRTTTALLGAINIKSYNYYKKLQGKGASKKW